MTKKDYKVTCNAKIAECQYDQVIFNVKAETWMEAKNIAKLEFYNQVPKYYEFLNFYKIETL